MSESQLDRIEDMLKQHLAIAPEEVVERPNNVIFIHRMCTCGVVGLDGTCQLHGEGYDAEA